MEEKIKQNEMLFCLDFQTRGFKIYLTRGTFYGHIIRHTEINEGKIGLIQTAVKDAMEKKEVYQWANGPFNEFFIQQKCPDFLPTNEYIRVGLKKMNDKTVVVTSAYPHWKMPTKGVRNYDPSE